MKMNPLSLMVWAIAGLALLLVFGWYFSLPVFGWLVLAVILAVYLMGMERFRRILVEVEVEEKLLASAQGQSGVPQPKGGILEQRLRVLEDAKANGRLVDSRVFSEVLSARESARGGRGAAGIVILLGLFGTFFGLMKAIAAAGSSLETADNAQILLAIQGIFSSMMGIFGTSLCGLVAALFLNTAHGLLQSRRLSFMAGVEEFTQFRLIPYFQGDGDIQDRRTLALEKQLDKLADALRSGMQSRSEETLQLMSRGMENSLGQLQEGVQKTLQNLEKVLEKSLGETTDSLSALALSSRTALESAAQSSQEVLQSSAKSSQEVLQTVVGRALGEVENLTQAQMNRISEQWGLLVQTVQSSMDASLSSLQFAILEREGENRARLDAFLQTAEQSCAKILEVQCSAVDLGGSALREHAKDLEATLAASTGRLVQELAPNLEVLARSSAELMQAQRNMLESTGKRLGDEHEQAESLRRDLADAGTLMRVNQSEFQASLEMFRNGVEALLEKFTGGSAEQESQRNFLEQLQASLEAFHEKASEVLVENALRTQEILLEVLEQSRPLPQKSGEA